MLPRGSTGIIVDPQRPAYQSRHIAFAHELFQMLRGSKGLVAPLDVASHRNIPGYLSFLLERSAELTDQKKKGDRKQWQKEGVGGDRKQDNADEASRSNTDTATQNSGTGKRD